MIDRRVHTPRLLWVNLDRIGLSAALPVFPMNGRVVSLSAGLKRANERKSPLCPITSSARASKVGGTLRPRPFAVLR